MTCRDTRTGTQHHAESGTDGAFVLRMLDGPN